MLNLTLAALLCAPLVAAESPLERFEFRRVEMAVDFRIVLYGPEKAEAETSATAAFDRVRELNAVFSDYDEDSELRRLSVDSGPGKPVRVSETLWPVLVKAQEIATASDGAFDVTCNSIVRLWRRARRQHELPSDERLREARELTGYRLLRLTAESRSVELLKPGVRLDLGGIAKGAATQAALDVLRAKGFPCAMVEAGGDIALGDAPPGSKGWRIGLAPDGPRGKPRFYLTAARTSVSTSGDMWQFVVIDGKRYSHIIDPRSGQALTDRLQVTVVHPDGPTADALSTAVNVLGAEKGLKLVESVPQAAGMVVRLDGDKVETFASPRWRKLSVESP